MKARLRANPDQFEQTVFEFNLIDGTPADPSFEWEEEDEFRYRGSIFDVIEKKISGNKLKIRCIDDKDEASVIRKMNELDKSTDRDKKGLVSVQQFLSLLLFKDHNCCEFVPSIPSLLHTEHYNKSLNPDFADIIIPPPRCLRIFKG